MTLPYHPRAPLDDPAWFFGRTRELQQLFSYLNKPSPQNVQIVGQRRIGKSWLLRVIALDEKLRARYLGEPDKYTFIYWDLQQEFQLAPDLFFKRLNEQLVSHLPAAWREICREAMEGQPPEDALLCVLDLIETDRHRVVLLLDEFAAITKNDAFAESFFSHLRSVFSRSGLTCVTASYRSLGEMCHLGPDSPFFNIFSRIQLGPFTEDEAKGFITEPFAQDGITVEPDAVREVSRLAGSHPCFVSELCHKLANDVDPNGKLTKDRVEAHNGSFQTDVSDDFTYYWRRLSETEQAMLRDIADGNPPATLENPVYLSLERLSLVRRKEGKPVPFSVPFGQFIRDTRGTDVYFEKAFANPNLDGPNFIRLCEIVLGAAAHIPEAMRMHLSHAVKTMQGRPQDAMRICGRDVLDPLMDIAYQAELGQPRRIPQMETCGEFDGRADDKKFPKHLAAHFQSIRISGNNGAHPNDYVDACTPARAFLTVLETIHLAEDIYSRYPPKSKP